MSSLKPIIHAISVFIARFAARLLPDQIPVTFVGAGAARDLCESIGQAGSKKVLLVTDAMLVKLGIVAPLVEALAAAGVESSIYDGVEPDPTFKHVDEGFAQFAGAGCDAILAIGGGSPMDASKVIAAMATNGGDARKLEGKFRVRRRPVPLYAIPTTAGTGSEVTIAAVVSEADTHTKRFFLDPKLLPVMTALDPELMTGLPPQITAATGMDALTHAIESYIALTATPQTEAYALTAVRLIFDNLPRAYAEGSDLAARKAMALASYYAGLAFTRTSVGFVHAVAHAFGAYYRTPHGLANAIVLPHVLEHSREEALPRLAQLGDAIGVAGSTDAEKADGFIAAVRELEGKVGIPSTLDALVEKDIEPIARQACDEVFVNYPVPRFMSPEECAGLVRKMMA